MTNWRLSTLRSVEAAGLTSIVFGTALAKRLYDEFATLIIDGATHEERVKLRKGFEEICNQAYALRLLMRKSTESYECLLIRSGVPLDEIEHGVDIFGELDGRPDGKVEVTLTLFGALAVHPRSGEEQPRVLENAQVIVRRN